MGRATRLLQAPAAPVPSQVPGLLNNNNNNLQHLLHLLRNIDMIGDLACWAPHSQSKNILLSTSEILTECHVWLLASDHLKDTSGIQVRNSHFSCHNRQPANCIFRDLPTFLRRIQLRITWTKARPSPRNPTQRWGDQGDVPTVICCLIGFEE